MISRLVVLAACLAAAGAVTPVEKVVELLTKLSAQVTEEGKTEAAQYDKYACFCKEQADDKLYAIEKSNEKIGVLTAKIDKLGSEINSLTSAISDLTNSIEKNEKDIQNETAARKSEHESFLESQADMVGAISACDRALAALKDSKGAMGGKTALEALAQLREVVKHSKVEAGLAFKLGQPGKAYEYEYHSNDIIATIESLRTTFIGNKNDLEQEEFERNSMSDKKVLALTNEKSFMADDKSSKEALTAKKDEEKSEAEVAKTEETNAKDADQEFLDVLTKECEDKANLFDKRSKIRSGELTAMSEAMETLKTGVTPNWGSNRKLVDLQRTSAVVAVKRHVPTSFLQLRGARGDRHAVMQKALSMLSGAASKLHSPVLSVVALKARVSEDHFVKVRGLIKDLVAKLEADKMNEATQKSFCDKNMKNAVTSRDEAKAELESLESQISGKAAEASQLTSDIATLSAELAANAKALNEATELRGNEKASNDKTVASAGAGKEAVEYALKVLSKFYAESGSLLQTRSGYVPPKSDRSGKTVADVAPEIFDEDYKGKQKESKGIIGLLEVILADFDRTGTTVTDEEETAVAEFDEFKSDLDNDSKKKDTEKTTKEDQLKEAEEKLVTLKDEKKDQEALLTAAEEELEKLKATCVDGEESYEDRVAARAKEIEALKEALVILDTWQG